MNYLEQTLAQLACDIPGATRVFHKYKLDFAVVVRKVWQTLSLTEILLRIRSSLTLTKSLSYSLNLKTGA